MRPIVVIALVLAVSGCSKKTEKTGARPASVSEEAATAGLQLAETTTANEAAITGSDCPKAAEALVKVLEATARATTAHDQVAALAKSDAAVKLDSQMNDPKGLFSTISNAQAAVASRFGSKLPCSEDPAFAAKQKEISSALGVDK